MFISIMFILSQTIVVITVMSKIRPTKNKDERRVEDNELQMIPDRHAANPKFMVLRFCFCFFNVEKKKQFGNDKPTICTYN